jgi:hypothetical protein
MFEFERTRVGELRRDLTAMETTLGACSVLGTVKNVPGVQASALIEVFAATIVRLEGTVCLP